MVSSIMQVNFSPLFDRSPDSSAQNAESNTRVEGMLRSQCVNLGLKAAVAAVPLTCDIIREYCIPNTVSQAWYIGRAVHQARRSKTNIVKSIVCLISCHIHFLSLSAVWLRMSSQTLMNCLLQFATSPGKLLYSGKIIDVKRDVSRGYTMGQCTIEPLTGDEIENPNIIPSTDDEKEKRCIVLPFQNEFLYAAYVDDVISADDSSNHDIICTVPDLISVLGPDGEAIGSQELRYGLRVDVIAMAAHPLWTADERGLKVGGPKGFGLDMEFKSLGPYQRPRSVIEEFNNM